MSWNQPLLKFPLFHLEEDIFLNAISYFNAVKLLHCTLEAEQESKALRGRYDYKWNVEVYEKASWC